MIQFIRSLSLMTVPLSLVERGGGGHDQSGLVDNTVQDKGKHNFRFNRASSLIVGEIM